MPVDLDPESLAESTRDVEKMSTSAALSAWLMLLTVVVARAYRAFLLTLVAAAMVPMLWGWASFVVRGGSMEPTLSVGDVVVAEPFSSATESVPLGAVMLFTRPGSVDPDEVFMHRVAKRSEDGRYLTVGDANPTLDADQVAAADFTDQATICVPFVGIPLTWWDERALWPFSVWLVLSTLAFYLSSWPPDVGKHRRRGGGHEGVAERESHRSAARSPARHLAGAVATVAAVTLTGSHVMPVVAAPVLSARAANAANKWSVAVVASKVTSSLEVYDTAESSGWFLRGSVAVHISATAAAGFTVRSIIYALNGGTPITRTGNSLVFTLSSQGDTTVTYFATDNRGAAERVHTTHVKLDNQRPALAVTSRVGDMTHAQWRAACGATGGICGTTSDGVAGSGVANVTYVLFRSSDQKCFDGAHWTTACATHWPATRTAGTWLVPVPDALLAVSRTYYTITTYVVDVAGNTYNVTANFSVG